MDTIVKRHEAENARAAKAQAKNIMEAREQAAIVQRYEADRRKKAELDLKAIAFLWHSPFSTKFRHSIHCPRHIAPRAAVLQHRLCRDQAPKIPPEAIYSSSSSSSSKTPPENDDDTMKPKSENDDRWHCEFKHTERARERG